MKKEEKDSRTSLRDNSFGVSSVILGIFSILFSSPPLYGFLLGVTGLIFSFKQKKISKNKWGKWGFALSLIGTILSIAFFILILKNPEILTILNQLISQYNAP